MGHTRKIKPGFVWFLGVAVQALALFSLANLVLGLFSSRWNANGIWIRAGVVPAPVVTALVLLFALGVLFLARRHRTAALATRYLAVLLALACLADALGFYRLLAAGRIGSSWPLPLSLLLGLLLLAWAAWGRMRVPMQAGRTRRALWIRVMDHGAPLVLVGLGVLAHLLTFGATDYRRPADAAVVFGAAVRASGEASPALRDRTLTACRLYEQGLVRFLVLSGARNPARTISEPECMARIALAAGVPSEALILDETGTDSRHSVLRARELARQRGWERVLMVSHDYHLARIKLLSERAGLEALTVPAVETVVWRSKPLYIGREVLAWAYWYLRPGSA